MVPGVPRSGVVSQTLYTSSNFTNSLKGNLGQLYATNGWNYHRDIVEKYGGAVRIHGLLGVSPLVFHQNVDMAR